MLKIEVPVQELWDESNNEFIRFNGASITLEHSLVSVAKWESIYHKPFLSNRKDVNKSIEEMRMYVKCMTITQNVSDLVYKYLTKENMASINDYINDSMTATTVKESNKIGSNKPITSEVIYYWMIKCGIPFKCEKWHLNRLLMLIKVCDAYDNQGTNHKMSLRELMSRNAALNKARRAQFHTKG